MYLLKGLVFDRSRMKKILISLFPFLLFSVTASSHTDTDSLHQNKRWYVPDAAVVQYAGNMGMVAIGPGYDLSEGKISIDLLYGYVPKFDAPEAGHMFTLKSTYKPVVLSINQHYSITPIQAGIAFSYNFGDEFSLTSEEPIPGGYYWWSTRLRILGFAGVSVNRTTKNKYIKDVGAYAELGTYELLAVAWFLDEKLTLWDIASASIGVRVRL
jgi:hypothetical protein